MTELHHKLHRAETATRVRLAQIASVALEQRIQRLVAAVGTTQEAG